MLMRAIESVADRRLAGPPYLFYRKAALRVMCSDDRAISIRSAKSWLPNHPVECYGSIHYIRFLH